MWPCTNETGVVVNQLHPMRASTVARQDSQLSPEKRPTLAVGRDAGVESEWDWYLSALDIGCVVENRWTDAGACKLEVVR